MNQTKRNCKMCGGFLPPLNRYQTDWCWMCCHKTWKREYPRHYIKLKFETKDGLVFYEKVRSLRGVCPFNKNTESLIRIILKRMKNINQK